MSMLSPAKERGAFFTPLPIARFLTTWAVRSSEDLVLDPSAGEGVFLKCVAQRLLELGADRESPEVRVWGLDVHGASLEEARRSLPRGFSGGVRLSEKALCGADAA